MPFRDLTPDEKVCRSNDLSLVLHKLSIDNDLFDEDGIPNEGRVVPQILNELRRIYSDEYRQRYSDLLKMLNSISGSDDEYRDDLLSSNLENIVEMFRRDPKDDYYFRALFKLTDHIALEIQRNRDYQSLLNKATEVGNTADAKMKALNSDLRKTHREIEKASKEIREAHTEAQSSKMEIVAILSIFAAIVIAFSGGLTYLGGTISSSGDAASTAFSVMVCGLMLFNILAFLMFMVIVIIRLHRCEDENFMKRSMKFTIIVIVAAIDIIMLAVIGHLVATGSVML